MLQKSNIFHTCMNRLLKFENIGVLIIPSILFERQSQALLLLYFFFSSMRFSIQY